MIYNYLVEYSLEITFLEKGYRFSGLNHNH